MGRQDRDPGQDSRIGRRRYEPPGRDDTIAVKDQKMDRLVVQPVRVVALSDSLFIHEDRPADRERRFALVRVCGDPDGVAITQRLPSSSPSWF